MNTSHGFHWREFCKIALSVSAIAGFVLLYNLASAESKLINLWNGIQGHAETFGQVGSCPQSAGVAYSYTNSTSSIYWQQVWARQWSTQDGIHLLMQRNSSNFYSQSSGTVNTTWSGCYYNYNTARHVWQGASGPTGIRKQTFTSPSGTSSSATCWNGSYC